VLVQVSLVVHPIFHNFHEGFCRCFQPTKRLAYFVRVSEEWIAEYGYNKPSPKNSPIFIACIDGVIETLFKEWVVFPMAMAVLLLICGMQVPEVKVLWPRCTENVLTKKQQHDPGYLIFNGDSCVERDKDDPEWCALFLAVDVDNQYISMQW
jgi:hypothetical protein